MNQAIKILEFILIRGHAVCLKCEKENVRKVSRIAEKFRVLESPQESSL